jgi:hypothetical protein
MAGYPTLIELVFTTGIALLGSGLASLSLANVLAIADVIRS